MKGLLLLSVLLESALQRTLALDPQSLVRFRDLQGTVVGLGVEGLGELFLHPGDPPRLRTAPERAPDVWLRAAPLVWLQLASGQSAVTGLSVVGDGELAAALHQALAGLQLDWEEALSRWLGDIPAHALTSRLRQGSAWGRRTGDSLLMDLREYLQEECRQLPASEAAHAWLDAVDTLVMDTDRLEARLQRLERTVRDRTA